MGIEIPEEYGGQGGTFFQSILAVEELSAVDPSAGVIVDVQNTICQQRHPALGERRSRSSATCRALAQRHGGVATRFRKPAPARTPSRWPRAPSRTATTYLLTGRKLWITNAAEAGLFLLFANANPEAGYKGITAFLIERDFPGSRSARRKTSSGMRASSTCELILDNCRVPKANVLGEVGQGIQDRDRDAERGPHRDRRADDRPGARRARSRRGLRQAAQAVRQADRRIPGRAVRAGEDGDGSRSRPPAGLQRRPAARRRPPFVTEAAMAKYLASQMAEKVASKAIEVFGGVGITKDYPVEKLYRDAKIGRIYEGTSNIQLVTIAKQLLETGSRT